jgi:hypothetical protein
MSERHKKVDQSKKKTNTKSQSEKSGEKKERKKSCEQQNKEHVLSSCSASAKDRAAKEP